MDFVPHFTAFGKQTKTNMNTYAILFILEFYSLLRLKEDSPDNNCGVYISSSQ